MGDSSKGKPSKKIKTINVFGSVNVSIDSRSDLPSFAGTTEALEDDKPIKREKTTKSGAPYVTKKRNERGSSRYVHFSAMSTYLKEQGLEKAKEVAPGSTVVYMLRNEATIAGERSFRPTLYSAVLEKMGTDGTKAHILIGEKRIPKVVGLDSLYLKKVA